MSHVAVPDIPLAERRAFTVGEAAALAGLSVSYLYVLMSRGLLRTVKIGGRRIVTREALDELLAGEPSLTVASPSSAPRQGAS